MKKLELGLKSSYDLLHTCNKMFHRQEAVLEDMSERSVTIHNNLILLTIVLLFQKNVRKISYFLLFCGFQLWHLWGF